MPFVAGVENQVEQPLERDVALPYHRSVRRHRGPELEVANLDQRDPVDIP